MPQEKRVELSFLIKDKQASFTETVGTQISREIEEALVQKSFFPCIPCCDDFSVSLKFACTLIFILCSSLIIMFCLTISLTVTFRDLSTDSTSDALITAELEQLNRIRDDLAVFSDEFFYQFSFEAQYLGESMKLLEDGDLYKDWRSNHDYTYNSIETKGAPSDIYDTSGWFVAVNKLPQTNINDLDLDREDDVKHSSVQDFFSASTFRSNGYDIVYYGSETGLMRVYPFTDMRGYAENRRDNKPSCNKLYDIGPYEPRCRPWYLPLIDSPMQPTVFSDPYLDDTTGNVIITASVPVRANNGNTGDALYGIIGNDILVNELRDAFSVRILGGSGYAFATNSTGYVIFHPEHALDSDYVSHIKDLEGSWFESNSDFFTQTKGEATYKNKNGNKMYFAWSVSSIPNYHIGVTVAEKDITEGATKTVDDINQSITTQIIILVMLMVVLLVVVGCGSYEISYMVTKPVIELAGACEDIRNGNLDVILEGENWNPTSSDVVKIHEAFKALLTGIRFGSEEYYKGNTAKAEECFEEARALFRTVNNQRGIGISQNNLGSVYSSQKRYTEAHNAYNEAIELAQMAVENAQSEEERIKATITLTSRMGNRTVCYLNESKLDDGETLIRKALDMDSEMMNAMGFVIKSGTLAKIFLKRNQVAEAQQAINEAFNLLKDENTFLEAQNVTEEDWIISKKYAKLTQAEIHLFNNKLGKAWALCDEILMQSNITSYGIEQQALGLLQQIYTKHGALSQANVLGGMANMKSSGNRDICFVYDYSGSMAGGRHRTAIGCLKDIFENHVTGNDRVSLAHFNHQVSLDVSLDFKNKNGAQFQNACYALDSPCGGTAFYQAVYEICKDMKSHANVGKGKREKWIIALTDGEDNRSKIVPGLVTRELKDQKIDAFICVCVQVGQQILDQCQILADATPNGTVLDAKGGNDGIKSAFKQVEQMLEGQVILEKY